MAPSFAPQVSSAATTLKGMQHNYADLHLSSKLPPPSFAMARFLGAGTAGLVGSLCALWSLGPYEAKHIFFFAGCLLVAAGVAYVLILVRRLFRPSERLLRTTVLEVNRHGLWRATDKSRDLMLSRSELSSITVSKSAVNEVLRVVLIGRNRRVHVEGLESMHAFLDDLRKEFPRVAVIDEAPANASGSRLGGEPDSAC